MKKRILSFLGGILVLFLSLEACLTIMNSMKEGLRFAEELGNGINIGNSLDVKGLRKRHEDATVSDYELYWGNPRISPNLFVAIKEAGIKTVRIPVSWGEHLTEDNQIDSEWMARVEEVVHQALNEQLYVILDLHHEAWLIPTEEKEAEVTERFIELWTQVAKTFAEADEHLLFEGMNEPRLEGTDEEWGTGTEEARGVVNRLNEVFVQTVRASGGYNTDRWLLVPAYCTSGKAEALEALEIPKGKHIMVAVHAYYPYKFTLDDHGTSHWNRKKTKDTEPIDTLMDTLERLFISRNIPVVITEFGAGDKDNQEDRLDWTQYYLEEANRRGIPCLWWDNGKDKALIDRDSCEWTNTQLRDALIDS